MQIPGYVMAHSNIKDVKMWHFYLLLAGWASIYTVMNTSVILFLNEALGSIFLAGLALAVGSIFSMLFDGLFSGLQKMFTARALFMTSIIGMIVAILLFIISQSTLLVFLATIFFRISFDLYDITSMSYVLSKSLPAEYGQNLSYKQLAQGIGMLLGFLISAILLASSYFIGSGLSSVAELIDLQANFDSSLFIVKIILLLFLVILWFLAFILFDREIETLDRKTILTSFQYLEASTIEDLKSSATKIIKNIPEKIEQQPNQINLKTNDEKVKLSKEGLFTEIVSAITDFSLVIKKRPANVSLLWSMTIMGIFSYWDTFLATFLPIFFTEVAREQSGFIKDVPGSLLMLIFILPAMGFLPLVAKLGDKYGRHYFLSLGLILTAISAFFIGVLSMKAFWLIMFFGFGISFGYLFGMSSAKAQVATKLNEFLAVEKQLGEIDSNISAGPIMLIDNFGNIIGPLIGGAMINLIGFQGFFVLFSLLLFAIIIFTFLNFKAISGHSYIFQSPIKEV